MRKKYSLRTLFHRVTLGVAILLALWMQSVSAQIIYLSSNSNGSVGGVTYDNEDIISYDTMSDSWQMIFDGSDVGLSGVDVNAIYIETIDGVTIDSILMSFQQQKALSNGALSVKDSDIVRFTPSSIGADTAGAFEKVFTGESYGLTKGHQDIDAIALSPTGCLIISTSGNNNQNNMSSKGEDLLILEDCDGSDGFNQGPFDFYFDGSDFGLRGANGNIWGASVDPFGDDGSSPQLFMTAKGPFKVSDQNNLKGGTQDVFSCDDAPDDSEITVCTFGIFWEGDQDGFDEKRINALHVLNTRPPIAYDDDPQDDSYTIELGNTLNINSADGVLANDDLGLPLGDVESFGPNCNDTPAGNLGDTDVDANALTVEADGSFEFTPATRGIHTFCYTLANTIGSDTATVTLTVIEAPVSQADSYTFLFNADQSVAAGVGLFVDNGSGADDLGFPSATLTSFGGGSLSGDASTNAASASVSLAGGTLTVNAGGSWSLIGQPFISGTYTFDYRLSNAAGTSDAIVTLNIQEPPTAQADALTAVTNIANDFAAGALFADNGSGADNLGTPAAMLANFGGGSLGGAVTNNAAGVSVALAGGTLTVNADGSLSLANPTTSGVFTVDYRITNTVGTSDATITISIQQAPTAQDDAYSFLFSAEQTVAAGAGLFVDNGSGADDLGFPAATLANFGGGSLGGAVTDNAAGAGVALADGTLTVNADGSWSLTGQPFTPGVYTFDYRLTNAAGFSDGIVTLTIQESPTAQVDALTATINIVNNYGAGTLFADNGSGTDNLGTPAATLTSFGDGSLGGVVTDNAASASVALAGGTLTVNADGSLSLANPTTSGVFTLDYRITNAVGTSDATVTVTIQAPPVAQNDAYATLFSTNLAAGLFVNNGSGADDLGFPVATLTHFGGGSLGGSVTDNVAGATVALAGGTLQVIANGFLSLSGQPFTPGTYTFDYRLSNAAGFSDGTVTLTIQDPPTARADALTAVTNSANNFAAGTLFADNGSGADTLGTPAATVMNFGGGSLGGAVTDNAAGDSVALAGGTLTVNADGSLSLASPTATGSFTFDYRIQNTSGTSDATVTLTIQAAPNAQNDSYTILFNVDQNVAAGSGLFADNGSGADYLGAPAATLSHFGGGSLGGAVTDNTAGTSVALAGGTLMINANGSWTFTGQPFTPGTYTVDYRLTNTVGTSDATFTLIVQNPPTADDDSDTVNEDSTNNAIDVLANDDNLSGSVVASVTQPAGGASVGTASVGGGGLNVVFTPGTNYCTSLAGANGTVDFTYTLSGGVNPSNIGNVSVTVTCLNDAPAAAVKNGGNVQANMKRTNINLNLLTGVTDADNGVDGCSPSFSVASISSGTNGTVSNVNLGAGTFDFEPNAGHVGPATATYTVSDNGCPGIATSTAATITFNVVGPVIWFVDPAPGTSGAGTLSDPFTNLASANTAMGSNTSHRTFVYSGTASGAVTLTGAGTQAAAQWLIGEGASGSFDTLMGIAPSGDTIARPVLGGTRPTISNTLTLGGNNVRAQGFNLSTGASTGMTETGSPTGVSVSEVSVTTTTATAVNFSGFDGMVSLTSVSSNGAATGIVLSNTTGSFSVSGGTIANSTNDGVSLSNARSITFNGVTVNGAGRHGINGSSVTDFSFSNGFIRNAGDANEEHGVLFRDLFGTNTISNSTIELMEEDGIDLINDDVDNGTIDVLTISNTTIQNNNGAGFGENCITVRAQDNGNLRLVVTGSTLQNCDNEAISAASDGNDNGGFLDVQVVDSDLQDNGARGASFATANNQDMDFELLDGSTITGNITTPFAAVNNQNGMMNGRIGSTTNTPNHITITGSQNVIGGVQARAVEITSDDTGTMVIKIDNNNITEADFAAIRAASTDTSQLDLTLDSNNASSSGTGFEESVTVVAGSGSAGSHGQVCLNMLNNSASTGGGFLDDYRLRTTTATSVFELQDFIGNGAVIGDVQNWVNTTKSNTGTTDVSIAGAAFTASVGACSTP